jgi:hypothetical protein
VSRDGASVGWVLIVIGALTTEPGMGGRDVVCSGLGLLLKLHGRQAPRQVQNHSRPVVLGTHARMMLTEPLHTHQI